MFLNVLFDTFRDIGRCITSKYMCVARVFMYDICTWALENSNWYDCPVIQRIIGALVRPHSYDISLQTATTLSRSAEQKLDESCFVDGFFIAISKYCCFIVMIFYPFSMVVFFRPPFFSHRFVSRAYQFFSRMLFSYEPNNKNKSARPCVCSRSTIITHTQTLFYLLFEIRLKKYIYELSHLSHVLAHDKNKSRKNDKMHTTIS